MGVVYKARDTRLDRTVAIKVLPEHVASDPDLKQRFEREARTLAALSHPHICPIHDVGSQDGIDYLVMEHLEGETLALRLSKGALPLDQALQVAIQIADALDKAHHKGIVHRDLKPGNVMLTKGGVGSAGSPQAKLLDFGLAKLRPTTPAGGMALSEAPTVSSPITGAGSILGTFQYMAPEQLEGQEADARTDIFAFGAVAYEIVTGRKAFEGKSQASLIGAILKDDPVPMSSLQPVSPPALDRVVKTCLAKDPDDRWQSAGDVTRELKWIAEGGAQTGLSATAGRAPIGRLAIPGRVPWVVASAAVAGMLVLGLVHVREAAPAAASEMRLDINTPSTSDPVSFALSPDGRQIVFVASGDGPSQLWLRQLDDTDARPLAGTEGASFPFWSPDSRSLGFFAEGKLKRLEIGGGAPQTLADAAYGLGGTWSPDGTILFSPAGSSPLFRVSASGGEPEAVTELDGAHSFPQFLPGGQQFLFYVGRRSPEANGTYLGSLDSSQTTRLAAADGAGIYAPNGWLLFVRGGTLLAQRLDLSRRELAGDPVTVANSVASDAVGGAGGVSVSSSGLVAYRSGGTSRRQLIWFDRSGTQLGTLGAPDTNYLSAPRLSPDGRRAAVWRTVQGNADIWLMDGVRTTRFTFDEGFDVFPIWSPDGGRIVFDSNRTGHRDLYVKPSSGAGSEELLLESAQRKIANDWSPDGRFLAYHTAEPSQYDLWVLPMAEDPSADSGQGRQPFVFLNSRFLEAGLTFSPDGRWVAYTSDESGRDEVHVRPFHGASSAPPADSAVAGQWQVSTAGGIFPRWRSDGRELYYIAPDSTLMAVPVTAAGAVIQPGTPLALFQTRIFGGGSVATFVGPQYDVSSDGRFLINTVLEEASSPITLLQNWNPEAER
jgi:Tol biopolymer transport system component